MVGVCGSGAAGEGVLVTVVVVAIEAHGGGVAIAGDWGDEVAGLLLVVGHWLVVIASVVEKGIWAGCLRGIVATAGGGGGV